MHIDPKRFYDIVRKYRGFFRDVFQEQALYASGEDASEEFITIEIDPEIVEENSLQGDEIHLFFGGPENELGIEAMCYNSGKEKVRTTIACCPSFRKKPLFRRKEIFAHEFIHAMLALEGGDFGMLAQRHLLLSQVFDAIGYNPIWSRRDYERALDEAVDDLLVSFDSMVGILKRDHGLTLETFRETANVDVQRCREIISGCVETFSREKDVEPFKVANRYFSMLRGVIDGDEAGKLPAN